MKSFSLLPLLVASASAASLERRQFEGLSGFGGLASLGKLNGKSLGAKPPMKIERLKPTFDGDDVKRVRITYGPFKVKGAGTKQKEGNSISLDPQGTGWSYVAGDFPTNITILTAKMLITTPDGAEISNSMGIYNHHAFIIDASKGLRSNLQCVGDNKAKMVPAINSISGSAADSAGAAAKLNITKRPTTGNFIDKGSKILLQGDLVNYNNETKDVYMVSDMQYVEGKALGVLETTLHLVPVGNCEAKGLLGALNVLMLKPPKDQKIWQVKGGGLEVKDDGKLLMVRGHMHDGGVNMILKLNDETICDSRAVYNASAVGGHSAGGHHGGDSMSDGMLSDMSSCVKSFNVKKGDKIYMEANYDFEKHPLREHPGGGMSEQMALMAIIFGKELK